MNEKNTTLKMFPRKQTGFSKYIWETNHFFWDEIGLSFDTITVQIVLQSVRLFKYKWIFSLFNVSSHNISLKWDAPVLFIFININKKMYFFSLFVNQESAQCTFILKTHNPFCCFIYHLPDFLLVMSIYFDATVVKNRIL